MNTLNELAAALGDDANFSTTVTNSIATKLPKAGGTMTGNLNLGNNIKAQFGAGNDLQIYHNAGTSFITESGSSNLKIGGENLYLQNTAHNENYLAAIANQGVTLYYNNLAKIATTSTGIDVTGTVTADGLTVDGDITVNDASPSISFFDTDGTNQRGQVRQVSDRIIVSSRNNTAYGSIYFTGQDASTEINRMVIDGPTGDISFYEDTGTTAKLFWDSSAESLGIGTSSPEEALHVSGSFGDAITSKFENTGSALSYIEFENSAASGALIGARGQRLSFLPNGTETMVIDASGNVGINQSNPTQKLHVSGNAIITGLTRIGDGTASSPSYQFVSDTDTGMYRAGSNVLGFSTGASERMLIDSAGVIISSKSSGIFLKNSSGGTNSTQIQVSNTGGDMRVGVESSSGGAIQVDTSPYAAVFGNQGNYPTQFTTNGTTRMTIDASGNVGIGCTPGYAFEVRTNDTSVTPQQVIRQLGSGDAAIGFQIPSAANWYAGVDNSASDSFVIGRGLAVGTNVAMTIDASGNVGIGTVPSNWIDQSTALEIGPSMALEDYSVGGANASVIYNNAYRNASNVIVYKETDFASTYGQYNGEHIFNVAPSGTAGATISLTQALKMTQSEVVANGLGVDRDFRVESVNSQYALFVDAANNSVGIKTNATDAALNVNSQSGTIDAIRIQGSGGNNFIAGYGNQGNLSFTLQEGEGDDASTLILYRLGNAQHIIDADSNENVIFNEQGDNIDFRVESDANANALFVDASTNRVGILTASPSEALHVTGRSRINSLYLGEVSGSTDIVQGTSGNLYLTGSGSNITLGSSEAIFNEAGANIDFRVESDTNANMLFVDGGANAVSVGMAAVPKTFNVLGSYENAGFYRDITVSGMGATYLNIGRKDVNGAIVDGLRISGGGDNNVAASHNGYFEVAIKKAGTFTPLISSYNSGTSLVVNESGVDMDFRVEGDSQTHALFVDASTNRVGIHQSSPSYPLDVNGAIHSATNVIIGDSSLSPGTLTLNDNSTTGYTLAMTGTGTRAFAMQGSASGGGYSMTMENLGTGVFNLRVDGQLTAGASASPFSNDALTIRGAQDGTAIKFEAGGSHRFDLDCNGTGTDNLSFNNVDGTKLFTIYRVNEIVVNEDSSSTVDFRVESNTKNEMLYVDAGNDVVNINSTQTTHQMGGGYRTDGLLKDFKRDEAVATFNESATSGTTSRTRRLIIPLYNYGPVRITIMNGGHLYNNGAAFGFRETTFYIAMESSSLRVNTKVDGVNAGTYASSYGVPTATAHSSLPELKIEFTVAAQMTCSTHVRVEGYGANGIKSIETL